jgi:hypothetical protein
MVSKRIQINSWKEQFNREILKKKKKTQQKSFRWKNSVSQIKSLSWNPHQPTRWNGSIQGLKNKIDELSQTVIKIWRDYTRPMW